MTHDEILELAAAYVLGALEHSEEQAVREHLATCDLPHPEFEELGSVVPVLAEALEPVEPSADLRERRPPGISKSGPPRALPRRPRAHPRPRMRRRPRPIHRPRPCPATGADDSGPGLRGP